MDKDMASTLVHTGRDSHVFVSKRLQECNDLQGMEGGIDTAHVSYLHRYEVDTDPMHQGTLALDDIKSDGNVIFEIEKNDFGLTLFGRRNGDADTYYWRITQWLFPWYTLIPPFGEHALGGHVWVPMDDHSCSRRRLRCCNTGLTHGCAPWWLTWHRRAWLRQPCRQRSTIRRVGRAGEQRRDAPPRARGRSAGVRKGMGLYDASKAALLSLTRTLAAEEAAHGVRVNAVCPGSTLTDFHRARARAAGTDIEALKTQRRDTSMLGRWAEPSEVA
jgi:hypothetical protein